MKVNELITTLSLLPGDKVVVIPVVTRGHLGASASVGIECVMQGFDWDSGRVFLHPVEDLTDVSPEEVTAIVKSLQQGQSIHGMKIAKRMVEEREMALKEELKNIIIAACGSLPSCEEDVCQSDNFLIEAHVAIGEICKKYDLWEDTSENES